MCRGNPCGCRRDSERGFGRLQNEEISLLREMLFFIKQRRHRIRRLTPVPPGSLQASDED